MAPSLARFLALARPGILHTTVSTYTPHYDAATAGELLAQCTEVRAMRCSGETFPSWPPDLESLTVNGSDQSNVPAFLCSLQNLSSLTSLRLRHCYSGVAAALREASCFDGLHALRDLSVHFQILPPPPLCFDGLAAASRRGVHVTVFLGLLWRDTDRQQLWAALAQCPRLHSLQLDIILRNEDEQPSASEQQLLASISCRQLVMDVGIYAGGCNSDLQLRALLSVRAEELWCRLDVGLRAGVPVSWAVLAVRDGLFIVSGGRDSPLKVVGYTGDLPVFSQGWALLLEQGSRILGVPMHVFEPGPRASLVWRGQATADSTLEQACKRPWNSL